MSESIVYYRINPIEDINSNSRKNNMHIEDYFLIVNSCGFSDKFTSFGTESFSDYYFLYIDEGTLFIDINMIETKILPRQFIFISPGTKFTLKKSPDCTPKVYWAHFSGELIGGILSNANIQKDEVILLENDKIIKEDFNKLFSLFSQFDINNLGYWDIVIPSHFLYLLARMSTYIVRYHKANVRKQSNTIITKALNYIRKNYTKEISVNELAEITYLSTSHFRTVFKQATGFTPVEYINNMRINRACQFLIGSHDKVYQIAINCGFQSCTYMGKLFHKTMGMSPSEYRKKYSKSL